MTHVSRSSLTGRHGAGSENGYTLPSRRKSPSSLVSGQIDGHSQSYFVAKVISSESEGRMLQPDQLLLKYAAGALNIGQLLLSSVR